MSDVRVRKLQEFIKQEVSQMLMRGMKDPRIGFTTVTDVEVTGDLRQAKIYVSLFGSDKEKADTLQALKHARGHVRSELGKILNLRHVPEIDFDKVNRVRGLDVVIVTTAQTDEESHELLAQLGMPFAK